MKAHEISKDHPIRELVGVHEDLTVVQSDLDEFLYAVDKTSEIRTTENKPHNPPGIRHYMEQCETDLVLAIFT